MLKKFLQEEEGAQVIEYSMILATLSIALVLAFDIGPISEGLLSVIDSVSACFDRACD